MRRVPLLACVAVLLGIIQCGVLAYGFGFRRVYEKRAAAIQFQIDEQMKDKISAEDARRKIAEFDAEIARLGRSVQAQRLVADKRNEQTIDAALKYILSANDVESGSWRNERPATPTWRYITFTFDAPSLDTLELLEDDLVRIGGGISELEATPASDGRAHGEITIAIPLVDPSKDDVHIQRKAR